MYKEKAGTFIEFEEFSKPASLIDIHEKNFGSVIRKIDPLLEAYDHIKYFGCMLFFFRLTDEQIKNGPIKYQTFEGTACML